MADKKKTAAVITGMTQLADGIFSMWVREQEIAEHARAGQFVDFYCRDGSRLLPRPISICEIDRKNGILRFVFRIAGEGTKEISGYQPGEQVEIMGPLGNGFSPEGKKVLLMGGGIGIPPMLELAKELSEHGNVQITAVLGYRSRPFMQKEFAPYGDVYISTEDGSEGIKGNVLDVVKEKRIKADTIFACGPKPMLKGISAYAEEIGIKAQISLEERMACGIGACLACVCDSTKKDSHSNVKNKRICKDGPVFYSTEVTL